MKHLSYDPDTGCIFSHFIHIKEAASVSLQSSSDSFSADRGDLDRTREFGQNN